MTRESMETTPTTMDAAIKAMFEQRARRADDAGLRAEILNTTVAQPQVRGWRIGLPVMFPRGLARALILALLAAAVGIAALLAVGSLTDDPPPTGSAPKFIRPFTYAIPEDEMIRMTALKREVVAWISGPDVPNAPDLADPAGGSGAAGVVVGSGETAWSHGKSARFMLRTAPAEFLADLRDTAGVSMGQIVETTLDGRPALTVMLPGRGGTDIHVNGPIQGLSQDFVMVNVPARLTVADVDGATVFVLIWARTANGLDTWLPVADKLVSSIRFLRGASHDSRTVPHPYPTQRQRSAPPIVLALVAATLGCAGPGPSDTDSRLTATPRPPRRHRLPWDAGDSASIPPRASTAFTRALRDPPLRTCRTRIRLPTSTLFTAHADAVPNTRGSKAFLDTIDGSIRCSPTLAWRSEHPAVPRRWTG